MSHFKKQLLAVIFFAISVSAFGQAARSPFSAFGLGEPFGSSLVQNQSMGGIGVSQPQFWFINNQNPALLVFNYYTVFQAGMLIESKTIKGDTTNIKSTGGNLNYLVTAFPVKAGKWTTSVGVSPFTSVNYLLEYYDVVSGSNPVDSIAVSEQGSGGLSQVYWSNGVRLHDNWSVGIKAAYIFGSIVNDYSNALISVPQPNRYTIAVNEQTTMKDFQFTGGLSFSQDSIGSKDAYRISAGMTYSFETNLGTSKTSVFERRNLVGNPITSDTIAFARGKVSIPSKLIIGLAISKQLDWSVGVEYTLQDWSKFIGFNENANNVLGKASRLAAGGEVTPDYLSDNLLKRITYRVGLHYENTPFLTNSNQLKDFGINFGLSLPAGRSSLDFAFSAGKRGDKTINILEESYFRVYFGMTFNDQWFIRRKFD